MTDTKTKHQAFVKIFCGTKQISTDLTDPIRDILYSAGFSGPSYIDGLKKGFGVGVKTFNEIDSLVSPQNNS